MVSRLIIEVHGEDGTITSVTLDQLLRAAQRVDVWVLGVFLVEEPSVGGRQPSQARSFQNYSLELRLPSGR